MIYQKRLEAQEYSSPGVILDAFQQVATEHANILGLGRNELQKHGCFWVLLRTKYEVLTPYSGEAIVVTWPSQNKGAIFDRNYYIKDLSGNILIKGMSKWTIINQDFKIDVKRFAYPKEFVSEAIYDDSLKLPIKEQGKHILDYVIVDTDIDENEHLNNASGIAILPIKDASEFIVVHHNQAFVNEVLSIYQNEKYFTALVGDKKIYTVEVKEMK